MWRTGWMLIVACALIAVFWFGRGLLRDAWYAWQQPRLPLPTTYRKQSPAEGTDSFASLSLAEMKLRRVATSTNTSRPSSTVAEVQGVETALPASTNLAVPFLLQAPHSNWALPYQEACEEASLLMVDGFYRGKTERFGKEEGNTAILELIACEKKLLGFYKDTTAEETAHVMRTCLRYSNVVVRPVMDVQSIKHVLARGMPVILPAAGKRLKNPYFRNGGPRYHMLVIKGYTEDGRFITNDPGIGRGSDYLYPEERILEASHDWNGGDVDHGAQVMIVVEPKK